MVTNARNYRPISLAATISKQFEFAFYLALYNWLPPLATCLAWSHDMEIIRVYFCWNILSYYLNKGISVFSAFLDASEAFDITNHNLWSTKLIKRNVPMCIVRLLESCCRDQTIQTKWIICLSDHFIVTNGARQGGSEFIPIRCLPSWAFSPVGQSRMSDAPWEI